MLPLWERYRSDLVVLFRESAWGSCMLALGFEGDLGVCGEVDAMDVVPLMGGDLITLGSLATP